MAYSTPGVYVVEKSLFPPSVAQVETAIPAFIGYTAKAVDRKDADLLLVPKKVSSLLEYERYFGRGPAKKVNSVDLGADNSVASVDIPQFYYMYDAIRLFYSNGGGKCFIISIGNYSSTGAMLRSDFEDGLSELKKKDEPTLILFPDAVKLTETDLYELHKQTLSQCSELQDRFGIFDTYYSGKDLATFETHVDNLRSNIGVNNLKYGAVYCPWIKSSLPRDFTYADIYGKLTKLGNPISLSGITSSTDYAIKNLLDDYDFLLKDRLRINSRIEVLLGIAPTNDPTTLNSNVAMVLDAYETFLTAFKASSSDPASAIATIQADYQALIDEVYMVIELLDDILDTSIISTADLRNEIISAIDAFIITVSFLKLMQLDDGVESSQFYIGVNANYARKRDTTLISDISDFVSTPPAWVHTNLQTALNATTLAADQDASFFHNSTNTIPLSSITVPNQIENMVISELTITRAFLAAYDLLLSVINSLNSALKSKEDALYSSYLIYKNIIDYVNKDLTLLPPSGAVAGIYAYVDSTRGVWKAPANVSLSNVLAPSLELTDKNQENLNIDANSGKSVNVIRYFTGKGNLIWGARTLAGNDNEWRYISVRRFFNMVEESVKKSTSWAVFEPNDAGTWIKVKGMITNFLTLQWRDGALQGAKPDEAFYVKVGLGETMTSLDILEGRMNVEIGMAVVRPAEFIILIFSHKLATS